MSTEQTKNGQEGPAENTAGEATAAPARTGRRRLYASDVAAVEQPVSAPAGEAKSTRGDETSPAPMDEPVMSVTDVPIVPAADVPTSPAARPAPPRATPPATRKPVRSPMLRRLRARQTIRDHALMAAGAMAIPVPLLDMAAEAAIQVRMVKRLSEIHGIDFAEERAKTLVAAALGGFSAGWAAGSLLRYASFAMYFANFLPSAAIASAITWGIGRLFDQHFEKGGRLEDMHPDTAASALRQRAHELRVRFGGKPVRTARTGKP